MRTSSRLRDSEKAVDLGVQGGFRVARMPVARLCRHTHPLARRGTHVLGTHRAQKICLVCPGTASPAMPDLGEWCVVLPRRSRLATLTRRVWGDGKEGALGRAVRLRPAPTCAGDRAPSAGVHGSPCAWLDASPESDLWGPWGGADASLFGAAALRARGMMLAWSGGSGDAAGAFACVWGGLSRVPGAPAPPRGRAGAHARAAPAQKERVKTRAS